MTSAGTDPAGGSSTLTTREGTVLPRTPVRRWGAGLRVASTSTSPTQPEPAPVEAPPAVTAVIEPGTEISRQEPTTRACGGRGKTSSRDSVRRSPTGRHGCRSEWTRVGFPCHPYSRDTNVGDSREETSASSSQSASQASGGGSGFDRRPSSPVVAS